MLRRTSLLICAHLISSLMSLVCMRHLIGYFALILSNEALLDLAHTLQVHHIGIGIESFEDAKTAHLRILFVLLSLAELHLMRLTYFVDLALGGRRGAGRGGGGGAGRRAGGRGREGA